MGVWFHVKKNLTAYCRMMWHSCHGLAGVLAGCVAASCCLTVLIAIGVRPLCPEISRQNDQVWPNLPLHCRVEKDIISEVIIVIDTMIFPIISFSFLYPCCQTVHQLMLVYNIGQMRCQVCVTGSADVCVEVQRVSFYYDWLGYSFHVCLFSVLSCFYFEI